MGNRKCTKIFCLKSSWGKDALETGLNRRAVLEWIKVLVINAYLAYKGVERRAFVKAVKDCHTSGTNSFLIKPSK
jgi:hypothetical protein